MKEIANRIFKNDLPTMAEIEAKYKPRELKEGARVTRFAPSPTGFVHIGSLYAALVNEKFAHNEEDGIFILRIEDTDQAREVEGAADLIAQSLADFDIKVDEGEVSKGNEIGNYGPYRQSDRKEIYQAFIKYLIEEGKAYPCFATKEELDVMREEQQKQSLRPGYYGKWATGRELSKEEMIKNLDEGKPYVIRFKSPGNYDKRIAVKDVIKGVRELPENDLDIVIMKQDKLPTYHFAHVIDDHFMYTTHVIRGDEWFPSVPLHIQLFRAFKWKTPKYAHVSPIQKLEDNKKRKLSKRKDPEANVMYYAEKGYPKIAVIEYLMNLANSNYEDWKKANPSLTYNDFEITMKRLAGSAGALFDFDKLNSISREYVATLSAEEFFDNGLEWAKKYDAELADIMVSNEEYVRAIFGIERGIGERVRKDIVKWEDLRADIEPFLDDKFSIGKNEALELIGLDEETVSKVISDYLASYDKNDDKQEWFGKLRVVAENNGFALKGKDYKKNPDAYKGDISSVAKIFRVLLMGKVETPDLYSVVSVMGEKRVNLRILRLFS